MKKVKTNVLRILEQKHIDYETREYDYDDEHLIPWVFLFFHK